MCISFLGVIFVLGRSKLNKKKKKEAGRIYRIGASRKQVECKKTKWHMQLLINTDRLITS